MSYREFQDELQLNEINFFNVDSIKVDLKVHINDDFSKIEFEIPNEDRDVLIVKNPDLLWDCSCGFSNQSECKIHSKNQAKSVSERFGQGIVQIRYRDVKVIWKDSPYFWPPSADTIHMIRNLIEENINLDFAKSICEIGCGTNLMGIVLALKNENTNRLYSTDWLITPILFSRINWELNKGKLPNVSFIPILGFRNHWVGYTSPEQVDIDQAFCNPPYLPKTEDFRSMKGQSTVGGTDLLEQLIEEGQEFADEIFLNFSEIAEPEAREAEDDSSGYLRKIGTTHTVPFRVPNALNSEKYMNFLSNKRELQYRKNSRYPFWHDVSTYKISFR